MQVIRVSIYEGWNRPTQYLFLNEKSLDKAKPIVANAIDKFLSWKDYRYDNTGVLKYKDALPKIKSFDSLQSTFEGFEVIVERVDVL